MTALGAIITDVHLRSVLGGLRGLGEAGVPVVGIAPTRAASGLWSRYTRRREVAPDVLEDPVGFADGVRRVAEAAVPCVVYPGREEALDALLGASLPEGALLPYASAASLRLRDKALLVDATRSVGLAAPPAVRQATAAELRGAALPLPLPCVLKAPHPGQAPPTARVVGSAAELEALLASLPPAQPLIVQKLIEGPLLAVALVLRRDGELAASFAQEILHTWPSEAGTTRRAVSVEADPKLIDALVGLLRAEGFWGLAQFDVIAAADGPVVLDFNPRFYDSLPLASVSGVNLPAAWHAVATGDDSIVPRAYRLGVRFRWLEAELLAARHGALRLPEPEAHRRGRRAWAVWSPRDPVPVALAAASVVRTTVERHRV